MRRSGRVFALGLLVSIFLLANGFTALVAYTLLGTPRLTAEVTSCHSGKGTTCRGQWISADGGQESGVITGAGTSDLHEQVAIKDGPLGAYTDNFHAHVWVRSIFAVAVDGALIGIVVTVLRIRRRGPQALARLTAVGAAPVYEIGSNLIRRHHGADMFTVEDVDRAQMRLIDPAGIERWRILGEDQPHASILTVTDPVGTVAGYVRQETSTAAVNILDADGRHLVKVVYGRVYGASGVRYIDVAGNQPALGVSVRGAMAVRLDPDAPPALTILIFAQLQGAGWLAMARFRRKARPRTDSRRRGS